MWNQTGISKQQSKEKWNPSRKTIKFVWKSGWRAVLQWMTDKWPPTSSNEINREGKESNCETAFLWKEKERKKRKSLGQRWAARREERKIYFLAFSTPQTPPSCFTLYNNSSAKMNPYRWGNCPKQKQQRNVESESNDPYFKTSENIANWNTSRTMKSKRLQNLPFPLKMY